jgi:3'(2'), 5'-bisphosphate nucleotidase
MGTRVSTALERDDAALAASLADAAGRMLVELRESGAVGEELQRLGDRGAHEYLVGALSTARPLDGVLSEEGDDDRERLGHRRVWIVDPLDGTHEYGEPRREDWAVHVALAIDGVATVGAVSLPAIGLTLSTGGPLPRPPRHDGQIRLVVSRSRPSPYTAALAARFDAVVVPMGSAGAKAMAVVRGDAEVYAHSGGLYEWDSAAPVAVATAAGLHASRLDGTPLRYNRPDPWLPDLLICRPDLAADVIATCQEPRPQ